MGSGSPPCRHKGKRVRKCSVCISDITFSRILLSSNFLDLFVAMMETNNCGCRWISAIVYPCGNTDFRHRLSSLHQLDREDDGSRSMNRLKPKRDWEQLIESPAVSPNPDRAWPVPLVPWRRSPGIYDPEEHSIATLRVNWGKCASHGQVEPIKIHYLVRPVPTLVQSRRPRRSAPILIFSGTTAPKLILMQLFPMPFPSMKKPSPAT